MIRRAGVCSPDALAQVCAIGGKQGQIHKLPLAARRLYRGLGESSRATGEQLTPKLPHFTLVLPRRNTGPQLPGQVLVLMLRGEEAGWVPVLGR